MLKRMGRILISTWVLTVLCGAFVFVEYQRSLKDFSYSPIDLSIYESLEFRDQYSGCLDETRGDIKEALAILEDMQHYSSRALDEKGVINKLINSLDERLVYEKGYNGSHTDSLLEGKGMCYHYAYLFHLLADSFGFEEEVLYGMTSKGYHVWNRIRIDDEWVYFDVTGCDNYKEYYSWLSEEEILKRLGAEDYKVVFSRTVTHV